jgi:hypothetical protein
MRIVSRQTLHKEVRYDPNYAISMASGDAFPGLPPSASRGAHYRGCQMAWVSRLYPGYRGRKLRDSASNTTKLELSDAIRVFITERRETRRLTRGQFVIQSFLSTSPSYGIARVISDFC